VAESPTTLRLGARGSLLSRLQSSMVARELETRHPGLKVELVIVTTSGDQIQDRPLHEFGGKGLFTKELEQALLRKDVDFAVHSFKDVPVTMPLVDTAELVIAAVPQREDPRDVLASPLAKTLAELPAGARLGTGSLRRAAQVLALRPDVVVLPIRGNVDTRIRKLKAGEYHAVILAYAGVKRAGLFDPGLMYPIPTDQLLPAAGQGALALQCRQDNLPVLTTLQALNHDPAALAVHLERDIVRQLNGDCHSPIAALATINNAQVTLQAAVAARDGRPPVVRAHATAPLASAKAAVMQVLDSLRSQGAPALLAGA
jgi:hydroxymethylbilane synthase